MMDFYQLLQNIKKRPTLYLSRCSIFDLQTFCNAYQLSRRDLEIPESIQELEFGEFIAGLRQKLSGGNHSWASLVLFHFSLESDERMALQKFFELWEEFLNQERSAIEPMDQSSSYDLVSAGTR